MKISFGLDPQFLLRVGCFCFPDSPLAAKAPGLHPAMTCFEKSQTHL